MSRRSSPFVYFTRISIENIRAFADPQQLDLTNGKGRPTQWTLIVGENGVGKTTLLQCLAWMRPVFNDDKTKGKKYIQPALVRDENADIGSLGRSGKAITAKLEATLTVGAHLDGRGPTKRTATTKIEFTHSQGEIEENKFHVPEYKIASFTDPFVLGYGAGRHMGYSNLDASVIDPIASLFSPAVELYDAEEILYRLDYHRLKNRPYAGRRLECLRVALAKILPDLRSPRDIRIEGPRTAGVRPKETGLYVRTPYADVPFSGLSLGYQTVTAWAVDIAWRLMEHYPESANPLAEPAVVLVDEIDLHLHPRWQRRIRHDLTEYFPNVQFIATAHSPLMAQTYLDANLAVVQRDKGTDHAVINNDPTVVRDWRLDQIVTSELFGFESARPPDIEEKMKRRLALLRMRRRTPSEKKELAALDREMRDLPTAETADDQKAMNIIRQAAKILETSAKAP